MELGCSRERCVFFFILIYILRIPQIARAIAVLASDSRVAVVATLAEGVVQWWGAIKKTRFKSLFTTPGYRELYCYYVESTQIDLFMLFGSIWGLCQNNTYMIYIYIHTHCKHYY